MNIIKECYFYIIRDRGEINGINESFNLKLFKIIINILFTYFYLY